jgi:hypothetical protein
LGNFGQFQDSEPYRATLRGFTVSFCSESILNHPLSHVLCIFLIDFLGILQKSEKRLSVIPHGKIPFPLDGFS